MKQDNLDKKDVVKVLLGHWHKDFFLSGSRLHFGEWRMKSKVEQNKSNRLRKA